MNKDTENQMERVRAARAILTYATGPPVGKDANRRRKQVELEAFMAIFHPGHIVPKLKENE